MQPSGASAQGRAAQLARRFAPALATLLLGLALTGVLLGWLRERAREKYESEFQQAAARLQVPLRARLGRSL